MSDEEDAMYEMGEALDMACDTAAEERCRAVAAERERCAKIAEDSPDTGSGEQLRLSREIAAKIRSGE